MKNIMSVTKVLDLGNDSFGQDYTLAVVKIGYLSEILKHQGYLFLNSAYSEFGLPMTREGHKLGWLNGRNDLKIECRAVENLNAVEVTFANLCDILNELPNEEEL